MASIHGGQIIARALKADGVDMIFTLTGGHILPILDGCVLEGIEVVDVRHEQAAVHAAEAYSRLTGKLGVAAVTAGPGVTDAITGVATAHMAHVPLLLLGGRHFVRQEQRGGLQEMDHPALFGSITTWSATAWETSRLADYMAIAARHAFTGRGGPVFVDVPLDVQADMVSEDTIVWPSHSRAPRSLTPDRATAAAAAAALSRGARPMIFAGGGYRRDDKRMLRSLTETLGTMAYLNSSARGSLAYGHPLLGSRTRSRAFAEADVVLALGVDWDFRTGYGDKINADATVIQVDAEPARIGWNRPAHLAIHADPVAFVESLLDAGLESQTDAAWVGQMQEAESALAAAAVAEAHKDGGIQPERFAQEVGSFFGSESIVAVDGGDIVSTTARWLQTSEPGHLLDPGPFGTLGTGPGYALAAKKLHPDKTVGIVFGDGGFGFNGMEFDTFVRLGLAVIGVVGNDGAWSNIKTLHQAFYPERVVAADLGRRPYHEMVAGLGGYGELVESAEEIRPALERARSSGKPALVNVHIDEVVRSSSNYAQ